MTFISAAARPINCQLLSFFLCQEITNLWKRTWSDETSFFFFFVPSEQFPCFFFYKNRPLFKNFNVLIWKTNFKNLLMLWIFVKSSFGWRFPKLGFEPEIALYFLFISTLDTWATLLGWPNFSQSHWPKTKALNINIITRRMLFLWSGFESRQASLFSQCWA